MARPLHPLTGKRGVAVASREATRTTVPGRSPTGPRAYAASAGVGPGARMSPREDTPHHPPAEASTGVLEGTAAPGFNPCCRGSPSSTPVAAAVDGRDRSCFNPCCRGSPSSTCVADRDAVATAAMFQSLLSWIALIDCPSGEPIRDRATECFNPCCRGSPSSTSRDRDLEHVSPGKFQSLLSWIALIDLAASTRVARRDRGFNPCCRGSPSSTRCYGDPSRLPRCRCFNPCCRGSPSSTTATELADDPDHRRFNPCCRGSPSSAPGLIFDSRKQHLP